MTRDRFMIYADAKASFVKNIAARIKFLFEFKDKDILKKNIELKNSGNDVCFILGNGPSLLNIDIELLNRYATFTVNYFYKGNLKLDSTYHVMIDPIFANKEIQYVKELISKCRSTKFILPIELYHNRQFNPPKNTRDRIYFVKPDLKSYSDFIQCDMSREMTGSINVIPFAIQCALYMGFKKIYLLGYEFDVSGRVARGHFYNPVYEIMKEPADNMENLIRGALVQRHNWAIANYCKKNKIIINNLTEETYIRAYPVQSFNKIMETLNNS